MWRLNWGVGSVGVLFFVALKPQNDGTLGVQPDSFDLSLVCSARPAGHRPTS